MAFRLRNVLFAAALVGVTTVVTTQVVSKQQDQGSPDMQAMMEAWMKYATPGKEHEMLNSFEGTWMQEQTHWMAPGMPPETSTSLATFRPILGGRFMVEELIGKMDMGGQEMVFQGFGVFGYDKLREKHIFTWCDNMGTMMMIAEGTADPSGKVITYYSTFPDPMSGKMLEIRSVSTIVSPDETTFEMFQKQEDGSWFRKFEMVGRRAN